MCDNVQTALVVVFAERADGCSEWTTDGDGYGRGAEIVLNQAGNVVTGSVGATNYFTIGINNATGEVMAIFMSTTINLV